MNLKDISKKDFMIFITVLFSCYIAYNVFRKQKQLEPNYMQSIQIAVVVSIIVMFILKYKETSTIETRLEEPFKTNVLKV
tara:strand:- start:728 stop:967 length:240 start_codon:yes stop_codon:yes gene_type:complete